MSALDTASLVFIPSGYEESKLFTIKPTNGTGDLTFTRASSATRVNAQGLIEQVPYNLLQQSNSFNNAAWVKTGVTPTGGQSGYDGSSDAWLMSSTSTVGEAYQLFSNLSISTISLRVKANATNWIAFRILATNGTAWFNLSTGSFATIQSAIIDTNLVDLGGGWYEISVSAATAAFVAIYVCNGNNTFTSTSGNSIYIQDAQLNSGSTAKTYLPTTDRLNVPRIDYTGGGCGSLLLEPQRTNLATYSQDFSNAVYSLTSSSITANAATSPDGTTNADKLVEDATTNLHRVGQGSIPVTSGQVYTFSFYAKAAERDELELQRINTSGTVFNSISVTTADLTLGTLSVGSNVTSSSINSVGDGWYRISISLTAIASGSGGLNIGMEEDGNVSYLGDGVSGVYLYGFQAEQGSYATSIINTAGTTVTRVADESDTTGLTLSSTSGFSVVVKFGIGDAGNGTSNPFMILSDDTSGTYIGFGSTSVQFRCRLNISGTAYLNTQSNAPRTQENILFISCDSNGWSQGANGVTNNTGANDASVFDTINAIKIFTNEIYGTIKPENIQIYNTRLTNSELETLTTI
jgi:hypothetical protein